VRSKNQREVRNVDRTVKDLQSQIDRREKQNTQLREDLTRMGDKAEKLLKTIDELQASESSSQLVARRAERDLREEKEKCLRLEREIDGWKSMKGSSVGTLTRNGTTATWRSGSVLSENGVEVPRRKSSVSKVPVRAPSTTKTFL